MKKLLASIIALISLFSITTDTFAAEEGLFERILDLNYGVEDYEIQLSDLDQMYFYSDNYTTMYNDFNKANTSLKREIIEYYREWKFTRAQTQGLVNAHKNFVYHTNQIFKHITYKELDQNFADVDAAILQNYKRTREAYTQIKKIVYLQK